MGDSVVTYDRVSGPKATIRAPVVNMRLVKMEKGRWNVNRSERTHNAIADTSMRIRLSCLSPRLPQTHSATKKPNHKAEARMLQLTMSIPSDFTYRGITGPVKVADDATTKRRSAKYDKRRRRRREFKGIKFRKLTAT